MADTYSLPESDPCYSTLEACKAYASQRLEAFATAFQYQRYGAEIEQWRQCCPVLSEEVEKARPEQPDPESLRTFALPAHIFNPKGSCAEHLYFRGTAVPQPRGKAWFEGEHALRDKYWESFYSGLKEKLHTCCIRNFDFCASTSGRGTAEGIEGCVQKYSPEHQPKVAVPGAPATSKTVVAEGQSLAQQYLGCQKERSEFQEQAAHAKKEQLALEERVRQGEAFSKELAVCQATAAAQKTELAGLQQQLQQTGYLPGLAALAAFPRAGEHRTGAAGGRVARCGLPLRPGRQAAALSPACRRKCRSAVCAPRLSRHHCAPARHRLAGAAICPHHRRPAREFGRLPAACPSPRARLACARSCGRGRRHRKKPS